MLFIKIKKLLRRILTPITIMFVPHTSRKTFTFKVPALGLMLTAVLSVIGAYYVYSVTLEAFLYRDAKEKLDYYSAQFYSLKPTISALKMAEAEFNRIFSLKSKNQILENVNFIDRGAIDMEALKEQLQATVDTVDEIKGYLNKQRDLYLATPKGWPINNGWVSSAFGNRMHPIKGTMNFHTGVDISAGSGTPIRATADGVVSFSGWSGNGGLTVVLDHGMGYRTFYAHNSKSLVRTGQLVQRGDVISYVGATGKTTGPHLHYEVWKNDRPVDPKKYLNEEGA